jgi:hypothetical protein
MLGKFIAGDFIAIAGEMRWFLASNENTAGVGIVYLIFLLTEMKCHDSWWNVFISSTMINKMLDK